ncbi:PfkB family carbohydrate kinase [Acidobacteriota bacterium]
MDTNFGLIGTITHDRISFESGNVFEGLGGILYQVSILCGLKKRVVLYTNLGRELVPDVEKAIGNWCTLNRRGIREVPGPGNQVCLHYPKAGERIETLLSVVPPLQFSQFMKDLAELDVLILVINSGFDIELGDFRKSMNAVDCPVWLDVHSLPLEKKLNCPRHYHSLPEWKDWAAGVSYLQANKKEVAAMRSLPFSEPTENEMRNFAQSAIDLGVKGVFITLGKEGVLVVSPEKAEKISVIEKKGLVDTTGCGDIFCAGSVVQIVSGNNVFEAASFGLELAADAVCIQGIDEAYDLASRKSVK